MKIVVAPNDGGIGMASALGVRFLDEQPRVLNPSIAVPRFAAPEADES